MRVKANQVGFYGKLRKVGDEFEISDKKALGKWMDEVKPPKAKRKTKTKQEAEHEA